MDEDLWAEMKDFMKLQERTLKLKKTATVFHREKGEFFSARGIQKVFKKLKKLAQVKSAVTPHSLRRSFVTCQDTSGMPRRDLQKTIGHAKMSTTEMYIVGPDQTK